MVLASWILAAIVCVVVCAVILYITGVATREVRECNDALVKANVLKDDNWKITGDMILKPSLASFPNEVGCHITFEVLEYE